MAIRFTSMKFNSVYCKNCLSIMYSYYHKKKGHDKLSKNIFRKNAREVPGGKYGHVGCTP